MVSQLDGKRPRKESIYRELGVPSLENETVFIELCAGSGILSSTAERYGMKVCPIDCERNRHSPFTKIFQIDLSNDKAWSFLEHVRDTSRVVAWHMGLPCGTCSRAREIQLKGVWSPPPLRDANHPMGLPWNSPSDAKKVGAANSLYERAFRFALMLVTLGHIITIENPTRSWLWELPIIMALLECCFFVYLHACMFGGARKKKTSLLTNEPMFETLSVFCDGSHEHAPWGIDQNNEFNTAKEAQYPQGFCDAYCQVLERLMNTRSGDVNGADDVDLRQLYRPFSQPRGRKVPQLIAEYVAIHTVVLDKVPAVNHKRVIQSPVLHIPAGTKLLRTEAKRGQVLCVFGIFHSYQQFVQASRNLLHPFDEFMNVPDILLKCMFDILSMGPVGIAKARLQKILEWKRKRCELESEEKALHARIPQHLRHLVKDKQFLLIRQLAQDIGWPDTEIHKEMLEGFRLVGKGTKSGVFKPEVKAATMTEMDLMEKAKFLRPLILGKIASSKAPEYLTELHNITDNEAGDKGWLEGPMSAAQVSEQLGDVWLPVQRFAVRQKNKLRPIDNFAENKVNEAWECPEKIDLHALDQLTWLISIVCKVAAAKGVIEVPLKSGKCLRGKLHEDWNMESLKCLISTLDLKDAYKQFDIHKDDRCKSVVSLQRLDGNGTTHYVMNCMPFGASSSVHNFNRIGRMIWAIGVIELRLPWVNYFDDYPIFTPSEISASTMAAAKGMLKLLGFGFAENKLEPFATRAEVLGVVVDCSLVSEGKLVYAMKESRRQEALNAIEDIINKGTVIPCLLPSVLGRLQFVDGQLAGRTGKLAMADIRSLGLHSKLSVSLDSDARIALQMLKERFMDNNPRTISLHTEECPVLLYTDGSYEPGATSEVAMIGGILLDGTAPARVFGSHVPKDLLARWHYDGKEHLIGQVEMYAVAVARYIWRERLHNRRGIIFIDNWPVLDCYIPGTARQKTWREILLSMEKIDKDFPTQLWATRVPSESNIADPPSRGILEPIKFLGQLVIDVPKYPMTGHLLA